MNSVLSKANVSGLKKILVLGSDYGTVDIVK